MSSNIILILIISIFSKDVEPEAGKKLIELLENPPLENLVRKQNDGIIKKIDLYSYLFRNDSSSTWTSIRASNKSNKSNKPNPYA